MTTLLPKNSKPVPNGWLAEQTIKIFLDYYLSFNWIKEYIFETRLKLIADKENHEEFVLSEEKEEDLLLCYKSFIVLSPTAFGLTALFNILKRVKFDGRFRNESYCDEIRYLLHFKRKAFEANHAGHHSLSGLWRKLITKNLKSPSAWSVYAMARAEESRIMGYEEEIKYWKEIKDSKIKSITLDAGISILSMSKYNEKRANEEEWVKDFKYRREEAKLRGDTELEELWNETVEHAKGESSHWSKNNFFLAAWCRTKATSSVREVATILRAAAKFFHLAAEKFQQHESRTIAIELVQFARNAIEEMKKLSSDSRSYFKEAANNSATTELADLYVKAATHLEERAKYLKILVTLENDDYSSLQSKLQSVKELSGKYFSYDFCFLFKHSCAYFEQVIALRPLVTSLVECGYLNSSIVFREQINKQQNLVKGYFYSRLLEEKRWWNPSLSAEQLFDQPFEKVYETDLENFPGFSSTYKPYIEKIIHYVRMIEPYKTDFDFSPPSDGQIAKVLGSFADAFLDKSFYQGRLASSIIQDYEKAIEYEDFAQVRREDGDMEGAKFYRIMEKYRLTLAEWRETCFQKATIASHIVLLRNFEKAVKAIESAERVLQNAIHREQFTDLNISKAEELRQAAEVYYLAAISADDQDLNSS